MSLRPRAVASINLSADSVQSSTDDGAVERCSRPGKYNESMTFGVEVGTLVRVSYLLLGLSRQCTVGCEGLEVRFKGGLWSLDQPKQCTVY